MSPVVALAIHDDASLALCRHADERQADTPLREEITEYSIGLPIR